MPSKATAAERRRPDRSIPFYRLANCSVRVLTRAHDCQRLNSVLMSSNRSVLRIRYTMAQRIKVGGTVSLVELRMATVAVQKIVKLQV